MSPELREFLTQWLEWATNGAPDREPFNRCLGLCSNLFQESRASLDELQTLLWDEFEDCFSPFGPGYTTAFLEGTQHLNPKRLAWVRKQLEREL